MVCQAKKSDMLKEGRDFQIHQKFEHSFWKYCYYLTYLVGLDKFEMTGLEGLVWENYTTRKTNWVPYHDLESLEGKKTAEEIEEEEKKIVEERKAFRDGVNDKLKKLEDDQEKRLTELQEKIKSLATSIEGLKEKNQH
jgi:polyhydroxyalkanoate synthesis regulator phasin